MMILRRSSHRFRVYTVFLLFLILAFLLPAVRGDGDSRLYLLAAAVPGFVLVFSVIGTKVFSLDRLLVLIALTFSAMTVLAPAAEQPDAALLRGVAAAGGFVFLLAGTLLVRSFRPASSSALILAAPSLLLILSPMISAPDSGLSSLAKAGAVLLLLPLAAFLSLRSRGPALLLGLAGFALLLMNTELLFAAAWGLVFVLMFWICDGTSVWSALCLLGLAGLLAGYALLFPPALTGDPVSPLAPLYAAAGFVGPLEPMAFSEESPVLPQDIFLSLGTQYGLLFLLILVLFLLLLLWRGVSLARQSRTFFFATLASGAVFLLWLRILSSLLTMFGIVPLPVVPLPLLSASFPETAADLFLLGMLCGVSARNEQDLKEDTHLAMLAR